MTIQSRYFSVAVLCIDFGWQNKTAEQREAAHRFTTLSNASQVCGRTIEAEKRSQCGIFQRGNGSLWMVFLPSTITDTHEGLW